jgi:hypothetical protein
MGKRDQKMYNQKIKTNISFFFVVLFIINNLLHRISEKIVIVILISLFFTIIWSLANIMEKDFRNKTAYILFNVNMYIEALFDSLYKNKMVYTFLESLIVSFGMVIELFECKIKRSHSSFLIASGVKYTVI